MTSEEYKQKLAELESEFKVKKDKLARDYAFANAKFKEGDIIKDETFIILVDKLKWGFGFHEKLPKVFYSGVCLKKDLTPRKDGNRETLTNNLEKIN